MTPSGERSLPRGLELSEPENRLLRQQERYSGFELAFHQSCSGHLLRRRRELVQVVSPSPARTARCGRNWSGATTTRATGCRWERGCVIWCARGAPPIRSWPVSIGAAPPG